MSKLMLTYEEWVRIREETIRALRTLADRLHSSHRENAETEQNCATASLFGDVVGLGGVILAPFSGGLSLALTAASVATGIGSFFKIKGSNSEDELKTIEIQKEVEAVLQEDENITDNLKNIIVRLDDLEEKLYEIRIDQILVNVFESCHASLQLSDRELESIPMTDDCWGSVELDFPSLESSQTAVYLNAVVTNAEKMKETIGHCKTIKQVISTARLVNQVSKTAKDLFTVTVAAQAGESALISTKAFASVLKYSDSIAKTAGVMKATARSSKLAAQLASNSGQIASAASSVTGGAKLVPPLRVANKGKETIEILRSINHTSKTAKVITKATINSNKALKTARITKDVKHVGKLSQTATKAASISKFVLAVNAVVIPLDIYNLVKASDNLKKSHDDVEKIRNIAEELENGLSSSKEELQLQIDSFQELYVQLLQVYEDYCIEDVFDFLMLMHQELEFDCPVPQVLIHS